MTRSFLTCGAIVTAMAAAFAIPNCAHAQQTNRIMLQTVAIAHGPVIRLSELLPAQAPAALRKAAEEVELGKSPLPGSHRILNRGSIALAANLSPRLRGILEIPPAVDVTRWSRKLGPSDLLAPIQQAMLANELLDAGSLAAGDLSVAAPVIVTEESPRLEVTRIEAVPAEASTRVKMWTPSEPRLAPFIVTIDRELRSGPIAAMSAAAEENRAASSGRGAPVKVPPPVVTMGSEDAIAPPGIRPKDARNNSAIFVRSVNKDHENPVVIKAGQPVELLVAANGMRLMTSAVSLAPGRRGEKIRIHVAMNGKTLLATVINAQTVKIEY